MDRQLIHYLPTVLRETAEFKALMAAQQPEVEALWGAQDNALENQFLLTAAEYGVGRWERILKIYPKDTDGLETRRVRILSILHLQLPYTVRWLRNWLDSLCGEGNYDLAIKAYTIALALGYDQIPDANKLTADLLSILRAVRPANMLLELKYQALPVPFVNAETLAFESFAALFTFNSRPGRIVILLDGSMPLDGSWLLDQAYQGILSQVFHVEAPITNVVRARPSFFAFHVAATNRKGYQTAAFCAFSSVRQTQLLTQSHMDIGVASTTTNTMRGTTLIRDSLYHLDGTVLLDGSRKLNADIIEEEI